MIGKDFYLDILEGEHLHSAHIRSCRSKASFGNYKLSPALGVDRTLNNNSVFRLNYLEIISYYKYFYNPLLLLQNNTTIAYDSTFISTDKISAIKSLSVKKQMRFVSANYFQYLGVWRWCPLCTHDDIDIFGTTFWRAEHQVYTKLYCRKHNISLNSECEYCGHRYERLQATFDLPPSDNKCAVCKKTYRSFSADDNDSEFAWIESLSESLFLSGVKSKLSVLRTKVLNELDVSGDTPLSKSDKIVLDEVQQEFQINCTKKVFLGYAYSILKKENDSSPPKTLVIRNLLFSNQNYASIPYLILLRLLFSRKEVESILLEC
ncbi:hypothetical protein [Aliikangiella sp. IMCC44632]